LTRSWLSRFGHVFGMIKLYADQVYALRPWPLSLEPDSAPVQPQERAQGGVCGLAAATWRPVLRSYHAWAL
jgi:hypothetical protein